MRWIVRCQIALLALLVTARVAFAATTEVPGDNSVWFGLALDRIRLERFDAAVPVLERLAVQGDARAQYLLGLALFEGKWVPQDRVRGQAWLQVAATGHDNQYFAGNAGELARRVQLQGQLQLSGIEAIRADQLMAKIVEQRNYEHLAAVRQVAFRWTGQETVSANPMQFAGPVHVSVPELAGRDGRTAFGCAGQGLQTGYCPSLKSLPTPRCTGDVQAVPDSALQSQPIRDPTKYVYPEAARRRGIDGSTLVLAHVDASGWVCMLGLVHSSGFDDLDDRAMRTAAQLRFEPVLVQGKAVEYLRYLRVGFSLGMDFRK